MIPEAIKLVKSIWRLEWGLSDPVPLGVSGRLNAPPALRRRRFQEAESLCSTCSATTTRASLTWRNVSTTRWTAPLSNLWNGRARPNDVSACSSNSAARSRRLLRKRRSKPCGTNSLAERSDGQVVQEGVLKVVVWSRLLERGLILSVQTLRYTEPIGALASTASPNRREPRAAWWLPGDRRLRLARMSTLKDPGRPLADAFQIDVEYFRSCPAIFRAAPGRRPEPVAQFLQMLNRSLCTAEEIQAIEEGMR